MSASPATMQAYVLRKPTDPAELSTLPRPVLTEPTDLLVEVHSVATNPVDLKHGRWKQNDTAQATGFDAAGVVIEVGSAVTDFKVGDEVFYSGAVLRSGNFAEYHLVDQRLVALKPKSLNFTEAAAFPLVSVTTYEALHDQMRIKAGKTILILPGGGGIGSIAIQLAKAAGLRVITTASRPETREWCLKFGADIVLDHSKGLEAEFKANNIAPVEYIYSTYSALDLPSLVPLIAVWGFISCINPDAGLPHEAVVGFFTKNVTIGFEYMFSRALHDAEPEKQGVILREIASMIDAGKLRPIHGQVFKGFEQIAAAQEVQKSGRAIGKTVIDLR